ncbi:uncharacterized protein BDW47DRAFT_109228 [Aspergillus candidus]|uniref:Uncharacterized protein n=1 Tax=Aspergillus candidus TaxID=41067 RepID=A0A2I2F6G8_ASPCN|nr:hypothetical protein BDW47DRAFT_109228 [Aspergillus candidus]PLB36168.1 hypothetical protein BDW47DRAFT_109228 [Aspergillus candidus]
MSETSFQDSSGKRRRPDGGNMYVSRCWSWRHRRLDDSRDEAPSAHRPHKVA